MSELYLTLLNLVTKKKKNYIHNPQIAKANRGGL